MFTVNSKKIIELLREFKDPESGEKIVKQIYLKEKGFFGPYLDRLPDLMIEFKDKYTARLSLSTDKEIFKKVIYPHDLTGSHDLKGIVVFYGRNIKSGINFNADIIDIAPTILSVLGIEIPSYMDGRAIQEVFIENLNIKIKETEQKEIKNSDKNSTYKDQREVEKRLKNLGYL